MTMKVSCEEFEQSITESGAKKEKLNTLRTKREMDLDRKAAEFINKSPSAIRKMPPKNIQFLVEDLQIQKTDLEIHNKELHSAQLEAPGKSRQSIQICTITLRPGISPWMRRESFWRRMSPAQRCWVLKEECLEADFSPALLQTMIRTFFSCIAKNFLKQRLSRASH